MADYPTTDFDKIQEKLQAPTPPEVVRWIPKALWTKRTPHSALALPTTNARFTQDRLDEVIGPMHWQVKSTVIGGLLVVGIGLRDPYAYEQWVWKWDTGQDDELLGNGGSDMRKAGRGVYSIGMRRAGIQWGIGRDVYSMPTPRLDCETYESRGKVRFSRWLEPLPGVGARPGGPPGPQGADGGRSGSTEPPVSLKADHQTFYQVAYEKLKLDREQALDTLNQFTDEDTGEIAYARAIMSLEAQLPEDERHFTRAYSTESGDGG